MCDNQYIKNIEGLYLLCKNIKVNNRIYNEYFKNKTLRFTEKLYENVPYHHIKKCVCNYSCNHCWKFTCESCKKGFNNEKIRCGDKNCYKYLEHVMPEVFEDVDKDICLIVGNYRITFNQANDMEKSLKVNEKLIFIKLLL